MRANLADALVERFDADWYRNPNAGPWIVGELFAEGQRELASELSARVAGRDVLLKLDFVLPTGSYKDRMALAMIRVCRPGLDSCRAPGRCPRCWPLR